MRGRTWITAMAAAAVLVATTITGACGPGDDLGDPGLGEQDLLDDEGKADSTSSTSTYYRGRFDARKCMFPLCGGVWVRRANFTKTKCLDGKWAAECYVAVVDPQKLGLGSSFLDDQVTSGFAAGTVLLRGKLAAGTISGMSVARLVAKEAWMAATADDPAVGDLFYRASDSGIRCFTTPCPSVHIAKLNSTVAANVDGVDLTAVPGTDADRAAAGSELMGIGLVIAAHKQQSTKGGKLAVASQAYRRVVAPGTLCSAGSGLACGPALQCCYPCGIPGCKHVCMAVDSCPLIP